MEIKFGRTLKELRRCQDMTQAALAKIMDVTPATVTRWENGTQEPDFKTLAKLAKFFDVSAGYLLGLEAD